MCTFLRYLFLFLKPQTEIFSLSHFRTSHLNLPPVPIVTFMEALLVGSIGYLGMGVENIPVLALRNPPSGAQMS